MPSSSSFFSLYSHDFLRLAVAIPAVRVADPAFHAQEIARLMREAVAGQACALLCPELSLSAYSCEDLFHQDALLSASLEALSSLLVDTRDLPLLTAVGLPIRHEARLFNCAVLFSQGQILGVIPKTYLPNYREFYELRQFSSASSALTKTIDLCGQSGIPFGSDLLFALKEQPLAVFHLEICEDLWVPIPPSCYASLAGATVLFNLSASNITIGKAQYRRQLASNQSARCLAAYLYSAAGPGESTTDLAWDGHALIYEDGSLVAESERFNETPQILFGDIDVGRLTAERMRQNSFSMSVQEHKDRLRSFRTIPISVPLPSSSSIPLQRVYERFPYVPSDLQKRDERCYEAYQIQVQGLVKRLRSSGIKKLVIGISGGLDSTHALIVCARAMDLLGLPRSNLLTYTMPAFATSERTRLQAHRLMASIGTTAREIDIRPSCLQMLEDIGHPYAEGQPFYDITFENVQAGERTSHLFRLANFHNALVVGTGDLSELALGWCTYGVGDHMSHYNVNASVPKTLIRYLIQWVAQTDLLGEAVSSVLHQILDTEISPELIPPSDLSTKQPTQRTEDVIGPYEIQDFYLYHILRFGLSPSKVAFLAWSTWADAQKGRWPDLHGVSKNQYTLQKLKAFLQIFLWRFFKTSQFKRSCVPNAPKVGSGGSLSPRGDWRAPSDSEATPWLSAWDAIPDHEPEEGAGRG